MQDQDIRRQGRRVFAVVILLHLATSFGAIALLSRMGPAIARVAEENVESITAIETMIISLMPPADEQTDSRQAFFAALESAQENVTESAEQPLLDQIRSSADAALEGDPVARAAVLRDLRALAEVNRSALQRADRRAQRLAEAGAWTAAFLAAIGFLFVRWVANRVERRFVMPLLEISSTLEETRQGDRFRRCSGSGLNPQMQTIVDGINELLDESERGGYAPISEADAMGVDSRPAIARPKRTR